MVYPNGLTQEAGGIVWRDASILQFGNGRQPDEKALNMKREADYISGASMIIRKDLWEKIGGFDKQFSPAGILGKIIMLLFQSFFPLGIKLLTVFLYHSFG